MHVLPFKNKFAEFCHKTLFNAFSITEIIIALLSITFGANIDA